ncbi:c-type cytochrome [Sphingomonas quercus]|uniref:C-type cytochrome n=1 Tax=Sphingomonas quercus TaxID=2842451 RepID=A0ABS6BG94_9SPHN|nr:c-type cytochrome [Sphingomonas quercus]MBU3077315.1 c-type cytochrome [Sphingomonas quercus]
MPFRRNSRIALAVVTALVAAAAGGVTFEYRHEQTQLRQRAEAITGGDAQRGAKLFAAFGCGACHAASGVPQAQGMVGPPLDTIGARAIIAGKLANNPDNLQRWIIDPQAITPGTAMPRLGVRPDQARDLSAFLYTQT